MYVFYRYIISTVYKFIHYVIHAPFTKTRPFHQATPLRRLDLPRPAPPPPSGRHYLLLYEKNLRTLGVRSLMKDEGNSFSFFFAYS